ncbi:MAG TPA: sigma 54-interacting transcriptional regulator [Bacteroidia bacterium]|jgi:two-component system response regulator AtoC|nr:sigma 54-interacting transcriptional regulator [Bacteroidia bacterium]
MSSTPGLRIFVVEDDEWYREFISYILSLNSEHEIRSFSNGKELLAHLPENPDLVTVDYFLPDTDGISLIKQLRAFNPEIETLVISQQEKVDKALELIKLGIFDYLVKSGDIQSKLLNAVNHISRNKALKTRVQHLEEEVKHKYSFQNTIIGSSEPVMKVLSLLEKASTTDLPVLLSGETGTGKEMAAKAIHYNCKRKHHSLLVVNMTTIPPGLAESELFGHETCTTTSTDYPLSCLPFGKEAMTLFVWLCIFWNLFVPKTTSALKHLLPMPVSAFFPIPFRVISGN